MKKQYSNKQRKIHKLKRENVKLSLQRASILTFKPPSVSGFIDPQGRTVLTNLHVGLEYKAIQNVIFLSEKIGKNSAKIQRLRTQIQQEKSLSDKFYAVVKELQENLQGEGQSKLSYFEEIGLMGDVAEEVGVLYEHPIDKDCYVFRNESGFVMKVPKAIVDYLNLKEILNEHSSGT